MKLLVELSKESVIRLEELLALDEEVGLITVGFAPHVLDLYTAFKQFKKKEEGD